MADESVKILIEAEDQASKKMMQVAREGERLSNSVKSAGGTAKKSADLYRAFGASLGGLPFGNVIGQFGELADKVGQFGEVAKAGAAGSLALKAGLVGVVAVAGYQAIKMLSEWVDQTDKLKQANKDMREEMQRTFEQEQRNLQKLLELRMREVDYATESGRNSAINREIGNVNNDLIRARNELATAEEDVRYWREIQQDTDTWGSNRETIDNHVAVAEQQLEQERQRLRLLEEQKEKLEEMADPRLRDMQQAREAEQAQRARMESGEQYVRTLRQELELERATEEERRKLLAIRNTETEAQRDEAIRLQAELDKTRQLKKEEQERAAAKEKEEAAAAAAAKAREQEFAKIKEGIRSQVEGYEQQVRVLTQGEEAAKAYALQQDGTSASTANALAKVDALMGQANKMAGAGPDASLSARGGRLSTGRAEVNQQLEAAKQAVKIQEKMAELLEQANATLAEIRSREGIQVVRAAA